MEPDVITVVVPIYKVERYLDRCLNSVVNQTYSNLEIILVDDGSPDRCPIICEEWARKDSRIKVVHKQNAGLGMARNTGIENATGKYICFFDSDDYVALDLIAKAYSLIKKYSADIVIYGMNSVSDSGRIVCSDIPSSAKDLYIDDEVRRFILPNMIANDPVSGKRLGFNMSSSGAMYSLELIQNNNWRFVSEREFISEDFYSLLNLYRNVKRVAVLHEACYFYCYNGNSLTHVFDPNRYKRVCHCYEGMVKVAEECNYPDEVKICLDSQFLGSVIASMKLIVTSDGESREKYTAIRTIIQDDFLQKVLAKMDVRNEKKQRKIIVFTLKHRMYRVVYLMLKVKS